MRIICLLLLLAGAGCKNHQKEAAVRITCSYGAATEADSSTGTFIWKPSYKIPDSSGPTIFNWQADSSLIITYYSVAHPTDVKFYKMHLNKNMQKWIPPTLLNGKFRLAGLYEHESYRNSGFYMAFYRYKNYVLIQHRESVEFLSDIMILMDTPENIFEKEGFTFPYKKEIKF